MNESFQIILTQQQYERFKTNEQLIQKLQLNNKQLLNHIAMKKRDYQEIIHNQAVHIKELSRNSLRLSKSVMKEEEKYQKLMEDYLRRQRQLLEKCLALSLQIENMSRNVEYNKKQMGKMNEKYEMKLAELKKQISYYETQINIRKSQADELKAQLSISYGQNEFYLKKIQKLEETHDNQIIQCTEKYDQLQSKYEEVLTKIDELNQKIKEQENNHQIKIGQINNFYQNRLSQLEKTMTTKQQFFSQKNNQIQQQFNQLMKKIKNIQQLLTLQKQQKQIFKMNNEQLKNSQTYMIKEIQNLTKFVEELKLQKQHLIQQKIKIKEQWQNQKLQKPELQPDIIQKLFETISKSKINIDELQKQNEEMKRLNHDLNANLMKKCEQCGQYLQKLNQYEQNINKRYEILINIQKQLYILVLKYEHRSSLFELLQKQKQNLQNEIKMLKDQLQLQATNHKATLAKNKATITKCYQNMIILQFQLVNVKEINAQNQQLLQNNKKQMNKQLLNLTNAFMEKSLSLLQSKNMEQNNLSVKIHHSELRQKQKEQTHLLSQLQYILSFATKLSKRYVNQFCQQKWRAYRKYLEQIHQSLKLSIRKETPKFYKQTIQIQFLKQLQQQKLKSQQNFIILFLYLKWIVNLH